MATIDPSTQRESLPVLVDPEELPPRTWVLLARTCNRLERRLEEALESSQLSLPQFDILVTIQVSEGITQQDLAQRLLVTKGNVCGMIDRMEAGGWVERRADPSDRRANRLHLTRKGRALVQRAMPRQHDAIRRLFGALKPGEMQTLHHLLDKLAEGLDP